MKTVAIVVILVVAIAAMVYFVTRPEKAALGEQSAAHPHSSSGKAAAVPVSDLLAKPDEHQGHAVAIEGKIVKECPSTGCWANINDGTGEIRITTEAAGFALPLGKEGATVRIEGKLVKTEDGVYEIAATGAELR